MPSFHGFNGYVSLSRAKILLTAPLTGGLFLEEVPAPGEQFYADHDQRWQSQFGVTYEHPSQRFFASMTGRYDSGIPFELPDGFDPATFPDLRGRANWTEAKRLLAARFAERSRDEWCDLLLGTDACFAPMLSIEEARWDGGAVHFSVHSSGHGVNGNGNAMLVAALAEDSAQSSVAGGENAGRNLHHVAVVRVMQVMDASGGDGQGLVLRPSAVSPSGGLRLVVFLADKKNGHVLAVAEQGIHRS